ncbi:Serine/threonine-protein kinase ULK4 [Camelus dromedarius]|uniref:Serine/threonine-protein kinase ULK4 n=1 Tax=Camelus dromedarius TaxID=9838 RepID=A0A5N4CZ21_CAMDR|nr:Serine/threonine-protein kinase ULK4 [Camelus dromedarius]
MPGWTLDLVSGYGKLVLKVSANTSPVPPAFQETVFPNSFCGEILDVVKGGLVGHVCHLFTETATLCLDVDNENNETAAALLFSLLDILHGMLTYTSGVVRLALQAQKSGSGGNIQAAEDLLLLSRPLTDLVSLLIPLVRARTRSCVCLSAFLVWGE